jgi:hypothetical protein
MKFTSSVFNEAKLLKQCLSGAVFALVGTSGRHRKFYLCSDQGFSRIRVNFVGTSDPWSELPINIGSFMVLPTEVSQETVFGQTGLAQSSTPEHYE